MPLPISTALLLAALALSRLPGLALHVVVYVLVGLAVLNEALRALVTSGPRPPADTYTIPAPRQRTPIRYDDDAS